MVISSTGCVMRVKGQGVPLVALMLAIQEVVGKRKCVSRVMQVVVVCDLMYFMMGFKYHSMVGAN